MSRKMIDYKVEDGTITSIDGYEVGGGNAIIFKYQDTDPPIQSYWTDNNNENNNINFFINPPYNNTIITYKLKVGNIKTGISKEEN